ncbi:hypothetical protein GXW82_10675 [Streptacidiphilus sp. 4-A2]|nr:hypothetical protein [Streptacidiphilus sp. 4-A2]
MDSGVPEKVTGSVETGALDPPALVSSPVRVIEDSHSEGVVESPVAGKE